MTCIVCLHNYNEGKSLTISMMGEEEAHEEAKKFIMEYVSKQQGGEKFKYEDLKVEPNLSRSYARGRFFVKEKGYKYTICEKIKMYGWMYNSYDYKKHISIYIFFDKIVKKNGNMYKSYSRVIDELKNAIKHNFVAVAKPLDL
jgi:hypothetical protein